MSSTKVLTVLACWESLISCQTVRKSHQQVKMIVMHGIEELIDDAKKKFLVQWVIARWEMHLAVMLSSVCSGSCHPFVFNLHGAKTFRAKGREKRNNHIAKSNCSKRSSHGKHKIERKGSLFSCGIDLWGLHRIQCMCVEWLQWECSCMPFAVLNSEWSYSNSSGALLVPTHCPIHLLHMTHHCIPITSGGQLIYHW